MGVAAVGLKSCPVYGHSALSTCLWVHLLQWCYLSTVLHAITRTMQACHPQSFMEIISSHKKTHNIQLATC